MPLSVDEIIQMGKQKGVDMSKYEMKLRQKYGQSGIPDEPQGQPQQAQVQQPVQPQQPQSQGLIPDLLNKVSPGLAITMAQGARGWQGAGGKESSLLDQQYKQAQINALNAKASGKASGYFYMDDQGNVVPVDAGGAKPLPAGTTPVAQGYKGVQTEATQASIPLKGEQTRLAGAQADVMEGFGSGNNNGLISPEATIGGVKVVNPEAYQDMANLERSAKGENTADSGRIALAKEAIKNIQDIKSTLFPTGQAGSFNRGVAAGSNVPFSTAPLIGSLIPNKMPFAKDPQDVYRKMGAALSGRQLIQTGVAARPEETAKLVSQFAPGLTSNPESALAGLDELEAFYADFLGTARPQQYGQGFQPPTSNTPGTLTPEQQAKRARLQQKYGV